MRIGILIIGIFFAFFSIGFNIYRLQIEKGQYYSARAESQYRLAGFLEPRRGNIYFTDKNNNLIPAAINKEYPVVFAVPTEVEDPEEAAAILSEIFLLNKDKIKNSLIKENDLYELLATKANREQIAKIKEANLRGIYIDSQEMRFYPFGNLAAHLLGFVGSSDKDSGLVGRYGLELYYEDDLKGRPGVIENDKLIDPMAGEDVVLTIDRNIQARAEEILGSLIKDYEAQGGTVIVQEPVTGKILAMTSSPGFDPNDYADYKINLFLNPAVQAIYEPGSIFKVITMAAGIDSGKITPNTAFFDNGSVTLNGRTIQNWDLKAHGKVTMTQVIEQSINTGAVFAQRKIGPDIFYDYLVKFGFNKVTDAGLPGEVAGNLRNLVTSAKDINFATASFGQGISVTPMGLINAISAIANKGLLMKPYLISGAEPEVVRRIISPEAANQVIKMMASAVSKAQIAQIPQYQVAGKTGTAQVPDFKNGGYTDQVINTYIGFAPAFDARFVILIKLDKPKGAPLAGLTVVPAFRELAQFLLNYYNIGPDNLGTSKQ
ncbi:MAG: hypothetical protein A2745_03605 [Candidatus Harrisonbacteria bacterium RIFCSPHIGHO2_01_FULL_44_13]|uniref:Penicillin-binding protein transpeptidase domain-containing protein n=1 Tax=Candidatus Harrisonbacteria bacterium RIFCSPLOWO2_01_FULL_44_18 TaxID=1798407 RepID=A0A1G1ZNC6_9BACT|nr:MAG: hypothetical protein A2745_03605 [Candidatus Harrisonbacteria bacterium RIFCSPHIGHO2_01_FULL_44_13]OGY65270.1 MAG: hypothetical protein A3A16_01970 [Candidatus Harrisonbacteria bacterium RIFCSPLOWO2_01_FULL_44_18]